ncbi:hypothetical protein NF867_09305 [Solitalea sp. MAHUQ-68]|uniref:AAA domain-containing protein n=1 Tax=Solitalea agri TaxID=2953739 RepID=A0A9X2F2P3_9SPHI|nr:hypothetical protein [Solitalea agri]MCO4293059.1 hypothetical protein [Solitalea agri]
MQTLPPPISSSNTLTNENNLQKLLESQSKIRENKSKPITFASPILSQNENAVFFPRTINVIQGKAGVHKSRLAETICATFLKQPHSNRDLLGFKTQSNYGNSAGVAVCYVDTERNLSDQLPYALQQIQLKAGYKIEDHPINFDYISLLEFSREERFEMLDMYLEYIRQKFNTHVFIVLDVITDCVFNFNDSKDSMKLIDMMNRSINRYNVSFLCLIHENPGNTDKARGHLGTEITNKASTVLQVGFERDGENRFTDLIKVAYLKCRSSRKHDPFYVQYSNEEKGLVLADSSLIQEVVSIKSTKADLPYTLELLGSYLKIPMNKKELYTLLMDELGCKERTLDNRIRQIMSTPFPIEDESGNFYYLDKSLENKTIFYFLKSINNG